jgi:Ca-activated chloride channel family protein
MLVFDASRSMAAAAGDNAGLRRLDIVRSALARIIPQVAPKRRLGLVTYGPGVGPACANVNLDLLPQTNAGAVIMERVNNLRADGRTPLARAVRLAAEALMFRNKAATIVLLTDGEETCGGAPCALAQLLKEQGARTTVHVISYQIESAVGEAGEFTSRCLADATGGLYVPTHTEEELVSALNGALGCPVVSELRRPSRPAGK